MISSTPRPRSLSAIPSTLRPLPGGLREAHSSPPSSSPRRVGRLCPATLGLVRRRGHPHRVQHSPRRGAVVPRPAAAADAGCVPALGLGCQRLPVRVLPPAQAVGDPGTLLDTFALSYPSRRYHSALIVIIVHSFPSVLVLALI